MTIPWNMNNNDSHRTMPTSQKGFKAFIFNIYYNELNKTNVILQNISNDVRNNNNNNKNNESFSEKWK